jgi:5,5'-dehydrodivanillate O-demethylase
MNQDFVGWVGQGAVTDRKREHLGRSDRGIIMMRQRFFQDLDTVASGEDPKAIVRDPELNRCIKLPIIGRRHFIDGLTREQIAHERPGIAPRREFPFLVGQPDSVRRAYDDAMGFGH